MRIRINNIWKNLPSSLSEITLKQRIDYQNLHGNELDEILKSVLEIEDETERELELTHFNLEQMYRSVSFFLETPIESIKESEHVGTILNLYHNSLQQVFEDEQRIIEKPERHFIWKDKGWELSAPELKNGDKMSFGEFIDSKQIIQNMAGLGKNRWECLVPLCAIYLRQENEEYHESFLYEGSERLALMENLPLDIALQVGFFLSSSLDTFTRTFQSLRNQESKELVSM